MNYEVRIISDEDLPVDVGWVFVRHEGRLAFWLKESTTTTPARLVAALEDAWETFRRIDGDELLSWPMLASA